MTTQLKKIPPSIIALLLQFAALILVFLIIRQLDLNVSPLPFALLCGTLATILSRFAGIARWWLFIQFAFVPGLVLMLELNIPPVFYLCVFIILLVLYWSTFRTQVPLYLSSNKVWQALETQLPADQSFTFIDLGSGIGGVLTHLSQTHPHGSYFGVESAPLPFLLSLLRIKVGGYKQCTVRWSSLWDCDLSQYDVVFAYLSPVPMDELWNKVQQEMHSGSLFISNTFAVHDHPPQSSISVEDLHHSTLYMWRI